MSAYGEDFDLTNMNPDQVIIANATWLGCEFGGILTATADRAEAGQLQIAAPLAAAIRKAADALNALYLTALDAELEELS